MFSQFVMNLYLERLFDYENRIFLHMQTSWQILMETSVLDFQLTRNIHELMALIYCSSVGDFSIFSLWNVVCLNP
jgi:hypothetical protein